MEHLGHQIGGAFIRRNKQVSNEVETFNSISDNEDQSLWNESDIRKYESTLERFRNVGKFQVPFFQSPEITSMLTLPAPTIRNRLYEIISTMNIVFVLMAGMIGQIALDPLDVISIDPERTFLGTSHRTLGSMFNFLIVLSSTIHLAGVIFTSYYLMQLSAISEKHIQRTAALSGSISVWQVATFLGIITPLLAIYCIIMIKMPENTALACVLSSAGVFSFFYVHFFYFSVRVFPTTMLPWTYAFAPFLITSSTTKVAQRMAAEAMLKTAEINARRHTVADEV